MSKKIVETIYGKNYKYEVVEDKSVLTPPKYFVRCSDGSTSGSFSSLANAVMWAKEKAEKR